MSWFSSMWSTSAQAASPTIEQPSQKKRILEEKPEPTDPSAFPSQSSPQSLLAQAPSQTRSPREAQDVPNPDRNKVIFGAGLAFFAFSMLITRRAFSRRRLVTPFYTNAPGHAAETAKNVSGPVEAVEALSIATINVLSVTMMVTGGALWYLDINSLQQARKFIRGGLGVDGTGRSEQDAEEEFEEWMATTLARKDSKILKQAMSEQKR